MSEWTVDDRTVAAVLARERAVAVRRVAGLTRDLAAIVEAQSLTSHDDEHDPEGATIAFERASVIGLLDGARRDVEALDHAADRLRAGVYGRCGRCGSPITAARLQALPAATTCIDCANRRHR